MTAKSTGEFLSIPFFTKAYGSATQSVTGAKPGLYNAAGTKMLDISNTWSNIHIRTGKSVNRRLPLAGSSTPWIPPSTYGRTTDRWILSGSGTTKSPYGTQYQIRGPIVPSEAKNDYTAQTAGLKNPFYGDLSYSFRYTGGDCLNASNRARTEALVDLADSKAGLGENLAQAVKTADLFLDAGKVVIDVALALKRGRIPKIFRDLSPKEVKKAVKQGKIPDKLADQWLAFHYGWKPLAMDAYGLFELLKERLEPALLVHGRGQGRMSYANGFEDQSTSGFLPPYVYNDRSKASVRCGLTGRITSEEYLRTLNRVGLVNPVSLAWDLLPFSFVVDWVLPIGDVAYALTATAGVSFVGGHEVIRHERNVSVSVSPKWEVNGTAPSALYQATGFQRTALSTFPRPVPYIKSPFMGGSRITTIIALITKLTT